MESAYNEAHAKNNIPMCITYGFASEEKAVEFLETAEKPIWNFTEKFIILPYYYKEGV